MCNKPKRWAIWPTLWKVAGSSDMVCWVWPMLVCFFLIWTLTRPLAHEHVCNVAVLSTFSSQAFLLLMCFFFLSFSLSPASSIFSPHTVRPCALHPLSIVLMCTLRVANYTIRLNTEGLHFWATVAARCCFWIDRTHRKHQENSRCFRWPVWVRPASRPIRTQLIQVCSLIHYVLKSRWEKVFVNP